MENVTNEDLIRKQYSSALASEKEKLKSDYDTSIANLDNQKLLNQQATTKNIAATRADADKAAVARAEYEAASGLSSGARAQARIAADNQLAANITALRAAQQASDDEIARTKSILGEQYASAIKQAQQNNDSALAKALYEDAKKTEDALRSDQLAAAKLFADQGDYTLLGQLYGLTPAQIANLNGTKYDNGSLTEEQIKILQGSLGVDQTGNWDDATKKAAGGYGADDYYKLYLSQTAPALPEKALQFVGEIEKKYNRNSPYFKDAVDAYLENALSSKALTAEEVAAIIRYYDLV